MLCSGKAAKFVGFFFVFTRPYLCRDGLNLIRKSVQFVLVDCAQLANMTVKITHVTSPRILLFNILLIGDKPARVRITFLG